jgi:hypothetical protein
LGLDNFLRMDPLSDLPEFAPPPYLYHYTSTDGLYRGCVNLQRPAWVVSSNMRGILPDHIIFTVAPA